MKKLSLVFILALAFATAARADDGGAWINLQANFGWDKVYGFARVENRTFNDFSDREASFLAVGAGYKFGSWFKADLSYEYWDIASGVTFHKAVLTDNATLTRENLSVSIRQKLELAVNPANSAKTLTLRTRLRGQYAFPNSHFRPYAMAETFNGSAWVRSLYYLGTEIVFGNHSMLDMFYLYHVPAGSAQEHVIGVGYYFNF